MKQPLDPDVEFERGPLLWATVTTALVGLVVNFAVSKPAWLVWAVLLAGVVASFRSDYYESSGNNAAIGVFLGILLSSPVLIYTRITGGFGIEGAGDTVFASIAFGLAWLIIVIMLFVPIGYIAATVCDFTRKKVGGPIGY
jgi:hypothetical protein